MLSWIVDQERPHEAITATLSAGSDRGPRNDQAIAYSVSGILLERHGRLVPAVHDFNLATA
jgi:hypothetical protein